MCVLYFLYTWGNRMFCRHNGLCGVLDRCSPDSQHISVLMDHCKEILSAEPFEIYRVVEMGSPGSGWGGLLVLQQQSPLRPHIICLRGGPLALALPNPLLQRAGCCCEGNTMACHLLQSNTRW
jgi:hypothetical protein